MRRRRKHQYRNPVETLTVPQRKAVLRGYEAGVVSALYTHQGVMKALRHKGWLKNRNEPDPVHFNRLPEFGALPGHGASGYLLTHQALEAVEEYLQAR